MDPASVASPTRETEGMLDGSDAIADWPVLSALLNAAQGASWVAVGNGGGVGVGRSIHSGMVVVADGSELAERKIRRVFWAGSGARRRALRRRGLSRGAGRGGSARPVSFRLERRLGRTSWPSSCGARSRGPDREPEAHALPLGLGRARLGALRAHHGAPQYYLPPAERADPRRRAGDIEALVHAAARGRAGARLVGEDAALLDAAPPAGALRGDRRERGALEAAGQRLAARYPDLEVVGIVGDFEPGLPEP